MCQALCWLQGGGEGEVPPLQSVVCDMLACNNKDGGTGAVPSGTLRCCGYSEMGSGHSQQIQGAFSLCISLGKQTINHTCFTTWGLCHMVACAQNIKHDILSTSHLIAEILDPCVCVLGPVLLNMTSIALSDAFTNFTFSQCPTSLFLI